MTGTEDAEQEVVALERKALARWLNGDASGFLEICAPEVVYFDPTASGGSTASRP